MTESLNHAAFTFDEKTLAEVAEVVLPQRLANEDDIKGSHSARMRLRGRERSHCSKKNGTEPQH